MDLDNAVIAVTGASRGLGMVMSRMLLDRGAEVVGMARSEDKLEQLREEWGDSFHPIRVDVRDEDEVERAFSEIDDNLGGLDGLINNAGLGRFDAVDELAVTEWEQQIDTNLSGVYLCSRAAVPIMRRQNEASGFGGHIINIASIAGLVGNPEMTGYNASKFGVRGLSKALMKEVREDGIKVSCVYPGSIKTDFSSNAGRSGSKNPMTAESVARTVLHLLESPDNYLVSEVVMRPLRPRG